MIQWWHYFVLYGAVGVVVGMTLYARRARQAYLKRYDQYITRGSQKELDNFDWEAIWSDGIGPGVAGLFFWPVVLLLAPLKMYVGRKPPPPPPPPPLTPRDDLKDWVDAGHSGEEL